jgi:hypothetical protein
MEKVLDVDEDIHWWWVKRSNGPYLRVLAWVGAWVWDGLQTNWCVYTIRSLARHAGRWL